MAGIGAQAVRLGRDLGVGWVRHVHRLRLTVEGDMPSEPVLFVANHGFGGALDLNVFATLAAIDSLQRDRPLVMLTHHLAWIVRVGPLLEPLGARLASREHAMTALADGCDVLVFPGGDLEAAKVWSQRHQVQFHGRKGFAEVAIEAGVPVVPIVTRGAGNTVLVLSDGRRLARLLRLDRLARTKALPINIAAPYGLNPGVAGLLPYLPFPARLATRVLPARLPERCPEGSSARLPERCQEGPSGRLPERSPARSPEGSPELSPARLPAGMPERSPARLPERCPEGSSARLPERSPARSRAGMPERSPARLPERCPEGSSARLPERSPALSPARSPARLPERSPARSRARLPERSPARLPEGSPEAFAASIEASMQDAMDALGAPDLTRAAPRCAANGGRTSPGAGTRS